MRHLSVSQIAWSTWWTSMFLSAWASAMNAITAIAMLTATPAAFQPRRLRGAGLSGISGWCMLV
jgi:hypothetical protein